MKKRVGAILIALKVVQEMSNEERHKKGLKRLGKGFFTARRFNPCNPLSYLFIIIIAIVLLPIVGFSGLIECFKENPFKWD